MDCYITYNKETFIVGYTSTADDEYTRHNRGNLLLSNQMQLPKKQETFSDPYNVFFESTLNFEHFEKNKPLTLWYLIVGGGC